LILEFSSSKVTKRSVQLVEFNKLQNTSLKPTDMEKGPKFMTKLYKKHSSATKLPLDILTSEIVNHVANEGDSPLTNAFLQCTKEESAGADLKIQSISDPLNAIEKDMFKPKREIMRTPPNSISTPIKSVLKPETSSISRTATSTRSVRFADTTQLMDETLPGMIDESDNSVYSEWG
jgi:hypothetical protein